MSEAFNSLRSNEYFVSVRRDILTLLLDDMSLLAGTVKNLY